MGGARLVEAQIRLEALGRGFLGHEVVQHEHVGLLDDLCSTDALRPEQQVRGNRSTGSDVGDQQRFQSMEPCELLVDARVRVEAVDEPVDEIAPVPLFHRAHAVPQRRPLESCERAPEVPTSHDIRERVVVDRLVVLIRPDDAVDVDGAIRFAPRA